MKERITVENAPTHVVADKAGKKARFNEADFPKFMELYNSEKDNCTGMPCGSGNCPARPLSCKMSFKELTLEKLVVAEVTPVAPMPEGELGPIAKAKKAKKDEYPLNLMQLEVGKEYQGEGEDLDIFVLENDTVFYPPDRDKKFKEVISYDLNLYELKVGVWYEDNNSRRFKFSESEKVKQSDRFRRVDL